MWRKGMLTGLLLLALPGCANMDVIVQKQGEMEKRLESLAKTGGLQAQQISDLSAEISRLQESRRQDRADLELIKGNLKAYRVEMAEREPPRAESISRIEVVNREAGDRESGPPAEYVKAFGLFSANNYGEAIEAFEAFIRTNPDSEYAGNARYWIGECHYTRGNYEPARAAYQAVIDGYPASSKIPDAMLKSAFSLLNMNDQVRGTTVLNELIRQHPDSPAAASARERLILINGSKR